MSRYIHDRAEWPKFRWDQKALAVPLAAVRHRQGRLIGRMEALAQLSQLRTILSKI
ncbi:MAG TPA: DUF4172 domain-containing protein [Terriglobia bacterium]|nr:DUF4172 domain-containing protein [Terriglobia bacterium]